MQVFAGGAIAGEDGKDSIDGSCNGNAVPREDFTSCSYPCIPSFALFLYPGGDDA